MAQKLVSQADAVAGAFNQTRDVRHNKGFFLSHLDHTQHRRQGGKVVVCNDRLCSADHRNQGRFTHIRIADQTNVCQQLQLQNQLKAFPGDTRLCIAGNLSGRSRKVAVSPAAFSAACNDHRRFIHDVRHNLTAFGIFNHRSHRHLDDKVRRTLSKAAVGPAVLSVLRNKFSFVLKVDQCVDAFAALQHDVAAASTVATVRSACCDKLFPVEGNRSVAAAACLHLDRRLINKHNFPSFRCCLIFAERLTLLPSYHATAFCRYSRRQKPGRIFTFKKIPRQSSRDFLCTKYCSITEPG